MQNKHFEEIIVKENNTRTGFIAYLYCKKDGCDWCLKYGDESLSDATCGVWSIYFNDEEYDWNRFAEPF